MMSTIRVHDKEFEIYLSEAAIQERVKSIAEKINKEYEDRKPLFIPILNGSFMFASDLFKYLTIDAELSFIKLASYKGMKSTGNVITSIGLDADLFERDIIILEDIVDTGKTLYNFLPKLKDHHPASLKIA
ncbi:MAG TPA: phosphoribosyltransferase family protein, partial [Chitinophagaceae bacterium]